MLNAALRMLQAADGTPVCNVSFDLSAAQLAACTRATEAVRISRHRGQDMTTDDVLEMRELTGVSDELHRLAEHGAHGALVLPLARFAAMADALGEWSRDLNDRDWGREDELADRPIISALLEPMADLRAEALHATLGEFDAAPAEWPELRVPRDQVLGHGERDLQRVRDRLVVEVLGRVAHHVVIRERLGVVDRYERRDPIAGTGEQHRVGR